MATRAAIATGTPQNFTAAGTWGLIDPVTLTFGENAAIILPTAYGTTARSVTGTPGAVTLDGIGVKLNVRTGTTGTISVHLAKNSDHLEVAGTEVTINCSDLPVAAAADLNGGWVFFKFAAPVLLVTATAYEVEAKTSSASQVSLWRHDAVAGNICVYLRTTATGAPAAGDDLIITKEWGAAATGTAAAVKMDNADATDYGSAPTTGTAILMPGVAICNGGTFSFGTATGTNYQLKISNSIIVYSGGTFNIGTVADPIPRDSTAKLNFDCGANVDYGLTIRNLGTFVAQGLSRTAGKLVVSCLLNADVGTATGTALAVNTDTGWLDNDEIAVASTTRTAGQCEKGALNGNAAATVLTVDGFTGGIDGGVGSPHGGVAPVRAEVILLTRNVQIFGASAALQAYIDIRETATVDIDWTEFKWLGSATSRKTGISHSNTSGSLNIQYCSLHNFEVAFCVGFANNGGASSGWVFSNNVTFLIAGIHYSLIATSGTWTADSNIFMRNTDTAVMVSLADIGGTFTNNTSVGGGSSSGVGVVINENSATIGTISGNTIHSNIGNGLNLNGVGMSGTISNTTIWRNAGVGVSLGYGIDITWSTIILFGNTTNNMSITVPTGRHIFTSGTFNGDSIFPTVNGFTNSNLPLCAEIYFINCDFGTVSGIKTAHTNDINISAPNSFIRIYLINTKLASGAGVVTLSNLTPTSFISSQKHNQIAGNHKTWKKYGTITVGTPTGTWRTNSPSEVLTPNNASNKLESSPKQAAVSNGGTRTFSAYAYKSADYNGTQPRLILKRNDALGISADMLLATGATGTATWELLTGTTVAVTDDGVLEVVVDCDGTVGSVYVDDWAIS